MAHQGNTHTRRGVVTFGVTALFIAAIATHPTSVSATPAPLSVTVRVATVGPTGLAPAVNVPIDVCASTDLRTCLGRGLSGVTDAGGWASLSDSFAFQVPPGTPILGRATVSGVALRGISFRDYSSVEIHIDPVSEAGVEILEADSYGRPQQEAVLEAVRRANEVTHFEGLSLTTAIERARQVGLASPEVRALLPTWTPTDTPTPTPTPTATATRTLRPTGTPAACLGDCENDGRVDVSELVQGIAMALGTAPSRTCVRGYPDAPPDVADLVAAVDHALIGCPDDPRLADLVPISVQPAAGPSCYVYDVPLCLDVCFANVGNNSAPSFTISVEAGSEAASQRVYDGLASGDGECVLTCVTSFVGALVIDGANEVSESRERNNRMPFRFSTPTPPPTCPMPTPT